MTTIGLILIALCLWAGLYLWPAGQTRLVWPRSTDKPAQSIYLVPGQSLKSTFSAGADGLGGLELPLASEQGGHNLPISLKLVECSSRKLVAQKTIPAGVLRPGQSLKWSFGRRWLSQNKLYELTVSLGGGKGGRIGLRTAPWADSSKPALLKDGHPVDARLWVGQVVTPPVWGSLWRRFASWAPPLIVGLLAVVLLLAIWIAAPPNSRPILTAVWLALVLMAPFDLTLSPDEEDFGVTIVSTVHQARCLLQGEYPFWNSLLGLGMPHPMSQVFADHPLMPFFALLPVSQALVLLYNFQVILAVVGMWWLARSLSLSRPVALLCAATYILSTPILNYAIGTDFWPEFLVMFSLLPLLALLVIKLMEAPSRSDRLFFSVALGLMAGLLVLNGHAGVWPIHFIGLGLLVLGFGRRSGERWPWLLLAGAVFILVGGARIYEFVQEYVRFERGLSRVRQVYDMDFWSLLFWPIKNAAWQPSSQYNLSYPHRIVAFGGPFFVMAVWAVFARALGGRIRRALSLAFAGTLAFWFAARYIDLFSANCFIKDTIILFGTLLAGLLLNHLWQTRQSWRKWLAAAVVLQALALIVGVSTYWGANVNSYLTERRTGQTGRMLRRALREPALIEALNRVDARRGGRLYMSPAAERFAYRTLRFGSHYATLPLNGMRVVNGDFKGIDYSAVYPNRSQMRGFVCAHPTVIANGPLLDVLGIEYVLASDKERVAPGLEPVTPLPNWRNESLWLFRNPTSWPTAVVMDRRVKEVHLKRLPSCDKAGLLGDDFSPVPALRLPSGRLKTRRTCNTISISLPPAAQSRLILVNELYRPAWTAAVTVGSSRAAAPVEPVLDALIGVTVPAGSTELILTYRPWGRIAWRAVSGAAILACLAWLLIHGLRRRRRPGRDQLPPADRA